MSRKLKKIQEFSAFVPSMEFNIAGYANRRVLFHFSLRIEDACLNSLLNSRGRARAGMFLLTPSGTSGFYKVSRYERIMPRSHYKQRCLHTAQISPRRSGVSPTANIPKKAYNAFSHTPTRHSTMGIKSANSTSELQFLKQDFMTMTQKTSAES